MSTILRVGTGKAGPPKEPSEWTYLTNYIATGDYIETENPGAWVRLWVHGAGGNGGAGGGCQNAKNVGSHSGGGASGNNGAVGCHSVFVNRGEHLQIVIDSVKTQVTLPDGTIVYAEKGATGGSGTKATSSSNDGVAGVHSTTVAKAVGCNIHNINGAVGNDGLPARTGYTGGAAPAMPTESPYSSTPPASGGPKISSTSGSANLTSGKGGNGVSSSTPPIYFGGAGGGGGGCYFAGDRKNYETGGPGGTGAIGGVVLEKGAV